MKKSFARYFPQVVLTALLSISACLSQQITGSITGTVTDPGGAVISGATAKLTNTETGLVVNASSDGAGNFRFLLLPPGKYSLQISAAGFKTFLREDLIVEVDRSIGVPVALQVGQVSETVEVKGSSPLLDPNTSSLGTVMGEKSVVDLPLNGRNPMGLANLIPTVRGIGYFGGQVLSSWRLAAVSIGGGQPLSNGYLIDGIANDKMTDSGTLTYPTVDSTEEFKVQTNGMSAEFGRTTGGVISLITKGGTNQFHGNLFDFLRNTDLNANDFFANKAGHAITPDKVNQYGGTVGGPIQKDKLFFFFNYEGYRERSSGLETVVSPTAAQRTGDFSGLTTSSGALITIYDPSTTLLNAATNTYTRQVFPGNIIPSSRINTVGANILKYYPLPNQPGLAANLFLTSPAPINKDYYNGRLDYNISATQRVAFRFTKDILLWQFANYFNDIADVDGRKIHIPRDGAFFSYTNSLSPTLLFDGRIGFNHQTEAYNTPSQGFDITQLGMPASLLNQSQAAPGAKQGSFPRINASDLTLFGGTAASANHTATGSASGTVTKIRGSQTWKAGYEFRQYRRNVFGINVPVGQYNFTRAFTQGPNADVASATSGYSVASLLLGDPASGTAGINAASTGQLNYHALFFQDDWKVNRKLTLNLGLRWDREDSPTDRYNVFSNFNPSIASPLQVPGLNLKGGLQYPGANGTSRALLAPSRNFQPRAGFAYQFNPKTVFRGGYGITSIPGTQAGYDSSTIGFSSVTSMVATTPDGRSPANTLSNPFPQGLIAPTGSTLGASTGIGTSLTGALYNINRGYSQQWNFTVQHQPIQNLLVEAAYVGNRGVHLYMASQQLNALPDQDLSLGSALGQSVPNPFSGIITSGALAAPTVLRSQLLLPYPQYTAGTGVTQGGVVNPYAYTGDSIFHAFTLKIEKRFSRGFSILTAYSKSKLIDVGDNLGQVRPGAVTGGAPQDWNNLSAERSKSLYDVPQRLVITALWELPLGKSGNQIYKAMVGGWQVNGIATIQSGLPIPIQITGQTLANRPNVVPGVSDRVANQSIAQWFNTAAFSAPAPFTYGNVARTLPNISGATVKNLDFSLFKNFTVREKYKFQFRTEAFNLTNTPTFENPGTTFGTPTFGQVTALAFFPHPRVVQFGLKMQF